MTFRAMTWDLKGGVQGSSSAPSNYSQSLDPEGQASGQCQLVPAMMSENHDLGDGAQGSSSQVPIMRVQSFELE